MEKNMQSRQSNRILRYPEVKKLIPFSKSYIYALMAKGKFPKNIKLIDGGRAMGWWEEDIDQFINKRINETKQR
tara:strand:- start:34 stop:255 length:222 start_codon:yes stop_codon:yes gene_type:complete